MVLNKKCTGLTPKLPRGPTLLGFETRLHYCSWSVLSEQSWKTGIRESLGFTLCSIPTEFEESVEPSFASRRQRVMPFESRFR